MEKLSLISRVLLGLIFFIFGLNGFFHFIPVPPAPEAAGQFITALLRTGYVMPLVKLTEVICGLGFLTGLFIPLCLVMITSILINIVFFNFVLNPSGIWITFVIAIPYSILIVKNFKNLSPLLKMQ